jgi:ABC-type uncharacterized transport system permease subunit
MNAAVQLLNTLLPMLYAVAVMVYALDFFREDPFAARAARPLLLTVVVLHGGYLALRTVAYRHPPLASLFEVMTFIALAVTVVYLYVEYRSRTHKTGMFLLTFSFVFQTVSSAFVPAGIDFPEILRSPLFGVHTGSAVLGYAAFAVSAIYGILFLALYHDLKASRFGIVYRRLPSLELLARMSVRAAVFGVVCLAFTIGFGIAWASREFPGFQRDPKFILSVIVWLVYAVAVVLHYASGWRPRRTIYAFLFGFSLMLLSSAAARFWLHSFHGFV